MRRTAAVERGIASADALFSMEGIPEGAVVPEPEGEAATEAAVERQLHIALHVARQQLAEAFDSSSLSIAEHAPAPGRLPAQTASRHKQRGLAQDYVRLAYPGQVRKRESRPPAFCVACSASCS